MNLNMRGQRVGWRHWRAGGCALVAGFLLWGQAVVAATFTTALDREAMELGESATLDLTFAGGGPSGTPALPNIPGLNITYVGPSSQFSFVNGQTSSTVTHHFTVTATRPGVYTIPGLSINVDGTTLSSQPLKLTVAQPQAPSAASINSGSQVAFAKVILPNKDHLYMGEVTSAELEIWLRDDVQNFGNLQLTAMPADGFNVGKLTERPRHRTQLGNRVYTVIPISIALTTIKTGTLTFGPLTAQMVIVLPGANNQGGDPFFRQFFNQGEQKQITLTSDTYSIPALRLPGNPPAGFTGAVGHFTMQVSEGPTNVSAGDPITLHVRLEGRGALDAISLPDFSTWNGFKTYPPTAKTEYSDPQGLEGAKTFEQIITPQNPEVREIPAFSLSYFDPDLNQYKTLSQPALAITVHPAGTAAVPSTAAAKPAAGEAPAAQSDILPAKQELGALRSTGAPLLVQPLFLAWQSLPVLALLAAFVWRRRTDSLANNPRLRRQRAVAQLVQAGQGDLRKFATENNSEQFFATLFRLLQEQLGERLDCPASAITESVVDDRLGALNVSASTVTTLRELFQACNQARYAPVRDRQELAAIAEKFETVIRHLQALKP